MLLGEHFEQFIKAQLASGRYANGSEVVREALRLLEDREKLRAVRLEELRAAIKAGIDSKNVGHAHPTRLPGHERTEIPDEELWEGVLQSKDGSTFEVNAKFVAPAAA